MRSVCECERENQRMSMKIDLGLVRQNQRTSKNQHAHDVHLSCTLSLLEQSATGNCFHNFSIATSCSSENPPASALQSQSSSFVSMLSSSRCHLAALPRCSSMSSLNTGTNTLIMTLQHSILELQHSILELQHSILAVWHSMLALQNSILVATL